MANNLILYYSRKGQNYVNGSIRSLEKGNTEIVAEFIQEAVGGTLFEVETVKTYAEDYNECIADAKEEGVDLMICSAYRSIERQQELFDAEVAVQMNNGKSKEEAEKITATMIAIPGTSEHHTGLAADIVTPTHQTLDPEFADTDAGKWLQENAAEYGFILRYPEDKQDITEIIYESWHYRYVGVDHAIAIKENGLCLEEYLEIL